MTPSPCHVHQFTVSLGCWTATNDQCRKPDLCPVIVFHGIVHFPLSAKPIPSNHALCTQLLGPMHFEPPLDFMDLFLPHPLSSPSRARAFLWLIFHYYQGPQAPNPFADEYSLKNPGKMPRIQRLTEEEMNMENVDMSEEIEWAKRKSNQRSIILRDLIETEELEKRAKGKPPSIPSGPKGKTLPIPRGRTFYHHFHCPLYLVLIMRDSIVLTFTRARGFQLVMLHQGTSALRHRHRPCPFARTPRGGENEKTSGTIRPAIKRL